MQVSKDRRKSIKKLTNLELEFVSEKIFSDFNVNLNELIENEQILIKIQEKYKAQVFLINKSDLEFIQNLPISEIKHFGVLIAHFFKETFSYHFEFLDLIAPLTNRKIVVDSKGEQTTLYGRNPTKRMLKRSHFDFKSGNLLIILNNLEEILGIGRGIVNKNKLNKTDERKVIIKNINDKGWYLRKGN